MLLLILKYINNSYFVGFGPEIYEIFNILSSHFRFSLSMMSDCTLNLLVVVLVGVYDLTLNLVDIPFLDPFLLYQHNCVF